jgi:hypothetical protein
MPVAQRFIAGPLKVMELNPVLPPGNDALPFSEFVNLSFCDNSRKLK